MDLRPLGDTGFDVSPLGLGTVKFGRNQQVKYPRPFDLPDDAQVANLLAIARDLGINLLDTAPAYGSSQQRLGKLLGNQRRQWFIVSKVGEIFENGQSYFDFSYEYTIATVERSLKTLKTDYLDCVLIHSDGDDLALFERGTAIDALHELKRRGLIRTHGISSKTVHGGLRAVAELDVVMATCNLEHNEEAPVLAAAAEQRKGVLIKKGLMSGHVGGEKGIEASFRHVFAQPGVSSMIVGTINPAHLQQNVSVLEDVLAKLA